MRPGGLRGDRWRPVEANHDGSPLTHKGGVLKAAQFELTLMASVEKVYGGPARHPALRWAAYALAFGPGFALVTALIHRQSRRL